MSVNSSNNKIILILYGIIILSNPNPKCRSKYHKIVIFDKITIVETLTMAREITGYVTPYLETIY